MDVWKGVKERSTNKRIRVLMAHTYLALPAKSRACDLLICDEVHRFTNEDTELFGRVIDVTKNRWLLCLSATLEDKHKKFLHSRGVKCIGQVTMKEARECEYVAEHYTYFLALPFTDEDRDKLDEINAEYHSTWKPFGYSLDEVLGSMQGGPNGETLRAYYSELFNCNSDQIFGLAKRAFNSMRERKCFLQKAPSKVIIANLVVKLFPGKKILTFSEWTETADQLTEVLGDSSRAIHSKLQSQTRTITKTKVWKTTKGRAGFYNKNERKLTNLQIVDTLEGYACTWEVEKSVGPATLKKENMALFQDSESGVNVLNTVRALDEAADIEEVDVAIILSFTAKARQTIQRIGRTIRWKKGKIAYIITLCMYDDRKNKKTQEQRWLERASSELDEFEWISIDQLKDIGNENNKRTDQITA